MNNNRTNGWGWIGMILVAALVGAGFLYQREGGKLFGPIVARDSNGTRQIGNDVTTGAAADANSTSHADGDRTMDSTAVAQSVATPDGSTNVPAEPADGERPKGRPTRSRPGTVEAVAYWMMPYQRGLWLYVDGKLVDFTGGQPAEWQTATLSLVPGEHLVEGCWGIEFNYWNQSGESVPAFHFESQRIQVESDQTQPVQLRTRAIKTEPDIGGGGSLQFYEQQTLLYDNDPLVKTLTTESSRWKVALRDKTALPKDGVVWMNNLPITHRGPRELNAAQVRHLVEWLKWHYWHAWLPDLVSPNPTLDKLVAQHMEHIDELLILAQVLDKKRS